MAERPTGKTGSEKSAEVVVVETGRRGCRPRRRAQREGQSRGMLLGGALHQKLAKPQGRTGRTVAGRGEAVSEVLSDEATLARHAPTDCGADDLLGQALARENRARGWKRVKANKGSAGVDGRRVQETGEYLRTAWSDIRRRLFDGSYRPEPVRRVGIPKSGGLIRRYLQAGILAHGVHSERHEGTPQGGPLSPLLANVLLDEVDRELERREHKFVRYAGDCNVYLRSHKAGERVLQALRDCYAKLALKVNESKTAVGPVWGRKFLGYCFRAGPQGAVKRAVAGPALQRLRERIRQMTRRNQGRSLEQIAQDLRGYVPGWKAYFRLAQTPTVMGDLDEWLRHRLRAVQLKQWRRGTTMLRELRKLGASVDLAARIAGNARRWWRNSRMGLNRVLPMASFDRLGVPKFS